MKPFLKWPGGKYRQVDRICKQLGDGSRLVEPFAGSAAIFLNTDFKKYLLADSNSDLINLYQQLQSEGEPLIKYCQKFFTAKNNNKDVFYEYRAKFNQSGDVRQKSALFLYLNRHGYNGLCRYNSKGEFNVPFGRYDQAYFPYREMVYFHEKSVKAKFIHAGFAETMCRVIKGDVVYCDPPYAPLSNTAYFTDYSSGGFDWEHQLELAEWAGKLSKQGIRVLISNHDIKSITELYRNNGANVDQFKVRRTISCLANNRGKVGELLAVFQT
jgi:DNA adenine methylase